MRLAPLALACLAAHGCGEEASGPPIDEIPCWSGGGEPTDGEVEIGAGLDAFEPIEEGQDLELHLGTQGLAHFFINARINGMVTGEHGDSANLPYTFFGAYLEDGTAVDITECAARVAFSTPTDEGDALQGGRLLVVDGPYIEMIQGQRLRIMVEVLDRNGLYASDERVVIPVVVGEAAADSP